MDSFIVGQILDSRDGIIKWNIIRTLVHRSFCFWGFRLWIWIYAVNMGRRKGHMLTPINLWPSLNLTSPSKKPNFWPWNWVWFHPFSKLIQIFWDELCYSPEEHDCNKTETGLLCNEEKILCQEALGFYGIVSILSKFWHSHDTKYFSLFLGKIPWNFKILIFKPKLSFLRENP